jgi:DNA-binding helix-hairpin-helix protein with protein kinase domain
MLNSNYIGLNHKEYILGSLIGKGGEGNVYLVKNDNSIVLKLYNEKQNIDKLHKLKHMIHINNQKLQACAAWPIDLIVENNEVIGFTMKIIKDAYPLHSLFSPMDRKKLFPDKGYNFLVHVSRNISVAFNLLHSFGIVVGDVNEGNILVDRYGVINFIDCDSFQIKNSGLVYFCLVGVPRYTPPEILTLGTFENVERTVNTDVFSMSILIFQLLFLGRHPFSGINLTNTEIDEENAIRNNYFFFSLNKKNQKIKPPLNSLTLDEFPSYLSELFHDTFENNQIRPDSKEWIVKLDLFLKNLKKCTNSNLHYFSENSIVCPWCRFKENNCILFFIEKDNNSFHKINDIDSFIQGYKIEKLSNPVFDLNIAFPELIPNRINSRFYLYKYLVIFLKITLIFIIIFLSFKNLWFVLISLIFLFIDKNYWSNKMINELNSRRLNIEAFQKQLESVIKSIKDDKELKFINVNIEFLKKYIFEYKDIPNQLQKNINELEERIYDEQLNNFLQKFNIIDYTIPSIAIGKKNILLNNGIKSAADISKLNLKKIPGFGPYNLNILFSWQRQFVNRFSYVPDKVLFSKEIENIKTRIKNRKIDLELLIKNEFEKIQHTKMNYFNRQKHLQIKFINLKKTLAQSELDYNEFRKKIKS